VRRTIWSVVLVLLPLAGLAAGCHKEKDATPAPPPSAGPGAAPKSLGANHAAPLPPRSVR
jgi:hypothetical protein